MEITADGRLIVDQGVQMYTAYCSVEHFEEQSISLLADVQKEWRQEGREIAFYYWTFEGDDKSRGLLKLICMDRMEHYYRQAIHVTAHVDEIIEAIILIKHYNSHVQFTEENPFLGYSGDDFVKNRMTAMIKYVI